MTKLAFACVLAVAAALAAQASARAENRSMSCQTIGGQTLCLTTMRGGGVSLSCRSDGGHILCLGSGGLRCESEAHAPLACRGGDPSIKVEILPNSVDEPDADDQDEDQ